jgi:hypothetical protein
MKTSILLLIAFAATSVVAQTPRPDLKGDAMGMTLSEFTAKHHREVGGRIAPPTSLTMPGMFPELIRDLAPGIVAATLNFPFEEKYDRLLQKSTPVATIATVPARIDYFFMRSRTNAKDDPRLYHIWVQFEVSGYSTVGDALIEKYGEPKTVEKSALQNRMGATFENVVSTWEFEHDSIVLTKFNGDVETSLLEFRDKARIVEFAERLKESSKKKADDL